jgi:hypothetical protein
VNEKAARGVRSPTRRHPRRTKPRAGRPEAGSSRRCTTR